MSQKTSEHIVNFILCLAKATYAYGSIKNARYSVAHIYRFETNLKPCDDKIVAMTMKALANVCGKQPTKQRPVTPKMIADLYDATDFREYLDTRDFTVMFLGWLAGMRGAEQASLKALDVFFEITHHNNKKVRLVVIRLEKTKTKKKTEGDVIVLASSPHLYRIEPMEIMRRYLELRQAVKPDSQWFYPNTQKVDSHITKATISKIVKKQVKRIGFSPQGYSSHSLRIGCVTAAIAHDIPASIIQKHGRWASTCWYGYFNDPTYAHLRATTGLLEALSKPRASSNYAGLLRNNAPQ